MHWQSSSTKLSPCHSIRAILETPQRLQHADLLLLLQSWHPATPQAGQVPCLFANCCVPVELGRQ